MDIETHPKSEKQFKLLDANEAGGVSVEAVECGTYCPDKEKHRSIPSMVDGLKPLQREILSFAFKHDWVTKIGVFELVRYVLVHFGYKYDDDDVESLTEAIVRMAHDFVGSNNINLFNQEGGGLFGSRLEGGKDYAPVQYLRTNLTPIARLLFPNDDDIFFDYLNEDGQPIEPTWHAPVIPLILVNGCRGTGKGWSTFVPNYKPKDLCANIRLLLENKPMVPIHPWYKDFQGTIVGDGASYTTSGKIEFIDQTKIRITELPVHTWTNDYNKFLYTLSTATGRKIEEPFIKSYVWSNTPHFEITLMEPMKEEEELMKKLKLTSTISTSNMHLFDPKGVIKKYDNPEQIVLEFFDLRLELYEKRRKMLLENRKLELFKLEYKQSFIRGVESQNIVGWTRADILSDLKQRDLLTLFQKMKRFDKEKCYATDDLEVNEAQVSNFYENIISSMNITTLISKKNLEIQKKNLIHQVKQLEISTAEDLWRKDLATLEQKLDELEKDAIAKVELNNLRVKAMYEADMMIMEKEAASVALMDMGETGNVSETVKPPPKRGVGDGRRAPAAEKQQNPTVDSNEDGEVLAGKVTSRKAEPSKRTAVQKQPQLDDHSDEEFGGVVADPTASKRCRIAAKARE